MVVEAAQHVIRCRSHVGVVAAQSHHGHAERVAGHKLGAIDHTLCRQGKGENDLALGSQPLISKR